MALEHEDPGVRTLARLEVEDGRAAGRDFEEVADRFLATSGVSEPMAVRYWREELRLLWLGPAG